MMTKFVLFVYDSSKPLEGVIAHLTRECGGNVHNKGIVNVTASSVNNDGSHQPKNAAYLGTDSIYCSKDEKDTWICYDFKERRVIAKLFAFFVMEVVLFLLNGFLARMKRAQRNGGEAPRAPERCRYLRQT